MGICSAAIAKAADQSQDAIGVLDETESQLLEVSQSGLTQGLQPLDVIVANSFGSIDNLYNHRGDVTGLRTGFTRFDEMTSGLQKGELIIIAARPSMGKTALAINIAENAAVRYGSIVAIFSLEMSKESLLRRMLASQASVDQQRIQKGFFGRAEQEKLQTALGLLVELPRRIYIDDSASSTIAEMRARARRLQQNAGGLDLILIDYLQLMSATMPGASKRGFENRVQEVSAISRGLKAMAKELKVPVIALSQLSRSNEKRDDKRPMLSDLRESGSIEQDADVVAFIHRESYYNRDQNQTAEELAEAEIIIAKQRNGPTGIVKMHWNASFTRFDGVDTHHEAE
jgi:replicative DNA helicase